MWVQTWGTRGHMWRQWADLPERRGRLTAVERHSVSRRWWFGVLWQPAFIRDYRFPTAQSEIVVRLCLAFIRACLCGTLRNLPGRWCSVNQKNSEIATWGAYGQESRWRKCFPSLTALMWENFRVSLRQHWKTHKLPIADPEIELFLENSWNLDEEAGRQQT